MEATKCDNLLIAKDFPAFRPVLDSITTKRQLRIVEIESVDNLIAKHKVEEYPFTATLNDDPRRPFVVIHTSGSTGECFSEYSSLSVFASNHRLVSEIRLIFLL